MEEEKLERSIRKSEIPGLTREEEEAQLAKVIRIAEQNLEHAKDLEGSAFRMADGSRVFVSQDLLKSARQALMEFLLQRGRMA
mgnify:CR=1 FL=1